MRRDSLFACALAAALPLLLGGCRGYYPSWHYVPGREVHQLHVGTGEEKAPAATTVSRVVGILRPAKDRFRRLHVRLEVENPGTGAVTLKTAATRATPSGAAALEPEGAVDVEIPPGARRTAEVYFPIPDPATLPNASLTEIELAWTLDLGGRQVESKATFTRGSTYRRGYYVDDPYWYPYGYWSVGPSWHLHGRIHVIHCD